MTRGRRCGGDDYRIAMQARIGRPRRVPQLTPNAVGNHVAEFHGAAGREVLAAFEESSDDKHRKADYDSTPPITESDHPAGMTPSGKQPKCCSLSQMSRRLIATMRGDAAGAREPMTTQQISTAQRARSRVRLFGSRCMLSFTGACFLFRLGERRNRLRVGTGRVERGSLVPRRGCHRATVLPPWI